MKRCAGRGNVFPQRFALLMLLTGSVWLAAQTPDPATPRRAQSGSSTSPGAVSPVSGGSNRGQTRTAQSADQDATAEKIVRYIRARFSIPDTVKLTVSAFRNSAFPEFYETTLRIDSGKEQRTQRFFVSKNGRYLVGGSIFTLGEDPRREVMRAISLEDQPSLGPANAPVTVVEYSDLQCPSCAAFHTLLGEKVVPAYGDKVRVVFKDLPLVGIHDWAMTGAIASQCVYQLDRAAYLPFRTLVFQNQGTINATNARDMLLHYGAQVGVDNLKLAACVDSKASLSRVEANVSEGQILDVNGTPTTFVNGQLVVGAPDPAQFFKILDEALQGTQ